VWLELFSRAKGSNCMKKATRTILGICLVCAGTGCAFPKNALCADAVAPVAGVSTEQITGLESALIEAISSGDWKTLELAAKGFKAAKLKDPALQMSVLRAVRQAALESRPDTCMRIEIWSLAARALIGDEKSLAALRAFAQEKISDVVTVQVSVRDSYTATQKAQQTHQSAVQKQEQAVLCMALLKEPGISAQALEILRSREKVSYYFDGNSTHTVPLILAVLASNPEEGFKSLLDYCGTEATTYDQALALSTLMRLYNLSHGAQAFNGHYSFNYDSFPAEADIAATLPKDAAEQLIHRFAEIVGKYKGGARSLKGVYSGDDAMAYDPYSLIGYLPILPNNAEEIAALEALQSKTPETPKEKPGNQGTVYDARGHIQQTLNKIRGITKAEEAKPATKPVKPPTPEKSDF
jgi:hypothetical protein